MRKVSRGHFLIGVFFCLAGAAIIGGFLIIGSPSTQRLIALDRQRISHLANIVRQIRLHWSKHKKLPANLADLSKEWPSDVADPETGESYVYRVTGERSYQLCAVFALEDDEPANSPWGGQFATHEKGLHCFDLKVERNYPYSSMLSPNILGVY